jgi:hypothetical protein
MFLLYALLLGFNSIFVFALALASVAMSMSTFICPWCFDEHTQPNAGPPPPPPPPPPPDHEAFLHSQAAYNGLHRTDPAAV